MIAATLDGNGLDLYTRNSDDVLGPPSSSTSQRSDSTGGLTKADIVRKPNPFRSPIVLWNSRYHFTDPGPANDDLRALHDTDTADD